MDINLDQMNSYHYPKINSIWSNPNFGLPPTQDKLNLFFFRWTPLNPQAPDGIQPIILQHHWSSLSSSITSFIFDCFSKGSIPAAINDSYISLILKCDYPISMTDFRPIGLCNSIYKLITKCISNRLKPIMDDLISPFQSSFIPNRSIEENIIIIKEVTHHFNKASNKANLMVLKIDLSKAFDCLEWDFIKDTLLSSNILANIVNLILSCICTLKISLLWNGEITEYFFPSRGIRQVWIMLVEGCHQVYCDKGIWVTGFAAKFNAISAASSELMAIREGLLLAWEKKIKYLELENDADLK
ncbi:uncharacterized protein LOC110700738 [Chenopodium quinoa]|uniref:uncharacterized protein LOC110700738 n=1 Tax=Chenopodium quinoa TaxID=63459 RepID=UPI000B77F2B7|nr:uncharacterized protein LOC110700738 [Chenopodium quinoa]